MDSAAPHRATSPDSSLLALVRQLLGDASDLVRSEVALAKAEIAQGGRTMGRSAGILAGGGVMLLLAVLAALAGVIVWLATLIGAVAACFVTALVLAIVGAAMIRSSLARMRSASLAPRRAIANVGTNAALLVGRTHPANGTAQGE